MRDACSWALIMPRCHLRHPNLKSADAIEKLPTRLSLPDLWGLLSLHALTSFSLLIASDAVEALADSLHLATFHRQQNVGAWLVAIEGGSLLAPGMTLCSAAATYRSARRPASCSRRAPTRRRLGPGVFTARIADGQTVRSDQQSHQGQRKSTEEYRPVPHIEAKKAAIGRHTREHISRHERPLLEIKMRSPSLGKLEGSESRDFDLWTTLHKRNASR